MIPDEGVAFLVEALLSGLRQLIFLLMRMEAYQLQENFLLLMGELVQLKLNIQRFYEVKYAMGLGGEFYPYRRKNKEPPLIEMGV